MSADPIDLQAASGRISGPPRPLRVLLIEDSIDDAALLDRHLRRGGFHPTMVRVETAEAMHQELSLAPNLFDLVLADYNLPRFSAPEALRLLKATAEDIPFIMMSGAVSEDTAVAAMRAGAHDYVSKQNLARLIPAIERELAEAVSRGSKRAAEQALRLSEQRFHTLVEATPLPLLISDMQGDVIYANTAVERLLGFSRSEVEQGALTLTRILPAASTSESAVAALLKVGRGRPGETMERQCLNKDGESIPVLLGAAVLNPEAADEAHQLAAFLVDLSEQKRGEEVLRRTEKLAAAGRLAASIAHEINNPLEAITNCLYLLAGSALPEEARGFLHLAQQELDRVTHITTKTLRFYRQSTRPNPTHLGELLETVLALYEIRLKSHSITVDREFSDVPAITAHDGEIRQVLANLVGNALDAMTSPDDTVHGRLQLRLRLTRDWQTDEPRAAISVADTGSGMSHATLRRIYEPFFSTKGITGTGLGLWVSQGIISKHRGRIQVRSRQGERSGTVFRLTLPLDAIPGDAVPLALPTLHS